MYIRFHLICLGHTVVVTRYMFLKLTSNLPLLGNGFFKLKVVLLKQRFLEICASSFFRFLNQKHYIHTKLKTNMLKPSI